MGLPVHHPRNISAWIDVKSRNLLNICENDIHRVRYIFPQELKYCDQKMCSILSKMSRPHFFESLKKVKNLQEAEASHERVVLRA